MLKVGYKASAEQFGPRELLEFGVEAERQGFDSVVVSDHFTPWRYTDGHAPFSFAWLGALAVQTSRIILGTSVVTPTFRYHPAIVAQAMATIACLAPGRVLLGVGTGESLNEVPVLAIPWPESPERFARLKEAISLMERLWREEDVTSEGPYYPTHRARLYDRPAEPVKLYVAASGPAAARLAGRMADGFICTSGKGLPLYQDTLLPALAEGLTKAGREPDAVEKMIELKVSFDTDRTRALEETRIWGTLALPAEAKMGVEDPRELERRAAALSVEQAASRWLVSDDPEEHLEQLRPYLELGFTHLVFHAPGPDQVRFLKLYGETVVPRIRERWG